MKYPNGLYVDEGRNIDYVKEVNGEKVATSGYCGFAMRFLLGEPNDDVFSEDAFIEYVVEENYTFVCPELFLEWDDA